MSEHELARQLSNLSPGERERLLEQLRTKYSDQPGE